MPQMLSRKYVTSVRYISFGGRDDRLQGVVRLRFAPRRPATTTAWPGYCS